MEELLLFERASAAEGERFSFNHIWYYLCFIITSFGKRTQNVPFVKTCQVGQLSPRPLANVRSHP